MLESAAEARGTFQHPSPLIRVRLRNQRRRTLQRLDGLGCEIEIRLKDPAQRILAVLPTSSRLAIGLLGTRYILYRDVVSDHSNPVVPLREAMTRESALELDNLKK